MIKTYALSTSEIDIAEAALEDIAGQLSAVKLLKNTICVAVCHYDFVHSGVYAAICESLPFPVVGFTTFSQANPISRGLFDLTLTILTSDDVRFAAAYGDLTTEGERPYDAIVQDTYRKAIENSVESPSLMFSFLSMQLPFTGDAYLRYTDAVNGGATHFGALAIGEDDTSENTFVLAGDKALRQGFVMLLMFGNVQSSFYYGSYPEENLLEQSATVTKASGNCVQELSGLPAVEFLRRNGFEASDDAKDGFLTIPFLYHASDDRMLVARTMFDYTDEGHALFFGEIPEESVFRIGTITTDEMLCETQKTVHRAVSENPDATAFFVFSCMGRYIALGLDTTSELDIATAEIPEGIPYLMCYAGGEICPVEKPGRTDNRFHNSSVVVCVLH